MASLDVQVGSGANTTSFTLDRTAALAASTFLADHGADLPSVEPVSLAADDPALFSMFAQWLQQRRPPVTAPADPYSSEPWLSSSADAYLLGQRLRAPAFAEFCLSQFIRHSGRAPRGVWARIEAQARAASPLRRFGNHWVAWRCHGAGPEADDAGYVGLGAAALAADVTDLTGDPRLYDFEHWAAGCADSVAPTCEHNPRFRVLGDGPEPSTDQHPPPAPLRDAPPGDAAPSGAVPRPGDVPPPGDDALPWEARPLRGPPGRSTTANVGGRQQPHRVSPRRLIQPLETAAERRRRRMERPAEHDPGALLHWGRIISTVLLGVLLLVAASLSAALASRDTLGIRLSTGVYGFLVQILGFLALVAWWLITRTGRAEFLLRPLPQFLPVYHIMLLGSAIALAIDGSACWNFTRDFDVVVTSCRISVAAASVAFASIPVSYLHTALHFWGRAPEGGKRIRVN